jgi:hypothetical protein
MIDFIEAVRVLKDAAVDFVVIGGWSAILHGVNYTTNDLDICYSRERANLKRLAAALAPFHPRLRDLPPELPFIWDETTLRNATVLTLNTDLGAIDLLAEVSGVGAYEDAVAHSIVVDAFGPEVRTLDLPAIIRAKRASARSKDLALVVELEALLESTDEE